MATTSIITPVIFLLAMAVFTITLGTYLVLTNPPKDRAKVIGIGAEKAADAEFED